MLGIAAAIEWGQQGPRSPVLKPEPEALSASCPLWKAWQASCVLSMVTAADPRAGSKEAHSEAFSYLGYGFPICERVTRNGTKVASKVPSCFQREGFLEEVSREAEVWV